MKHKDISLHTFYIENQQKAVISYRQFCKRVQSKKFVSHFDALTKKRENKKIKKHEGIKKKILKDNVTISKRENNILKDNVENISSYYKSLILKYNTGKENFIGGRTFNNRFRSKKYENKPEYEILIKQSFIAQKKKSDTTCDKESKESKGKTKIKNEILIETPEKKSIIHLREKKDYIYLKKMLLEDNINIDTFNTKNAFYTFYKNILGYFNIVSFKTFTKRVAGKIKKNYLWKISLLYQPNVILDFYNKNKEYIIKKSSQYKKYKIISYRQFRKKVVQDQFPLQLDTLLAIQTNKRKETEQQNNIIVKKIPDFENMFNYLSVNEKIDKQEEIKNKRKQKNKEIVLLFKTMNLETKQGTIKGIYIVLNKISKKLYEIGNLKGTEVYLIDPLWIKKFNY